MHPLLARQLKRMGLNAQEPTTDPMAWAALLARVNDAYVQNDQDRDLAERSTNLASDEMRNLQAKLEVQNAMLEDQVERRTAQLKEAIKRATDASVAKSQFLANMSHELRTPLTAILGFADLMLSSAIDPQHVQHLTTIRRNGAHLLGLLNDILDLSRIEAGKMTVERVPCSIVQVCEEVASLMRVRAQEKNLDLRIVYDWPLPDRVHIDPLRMRQILVNLVGNAVKFTSEGSVTLRVSAALPEHQDHEWAISASVIDTGPGIPNDRLPALFDRFAQIDNSMSRRFGGTGLGLSISNELASLLGGSIAVRSEVGKGSAFTVTLRAQPVEGSELVRAATRSSPVPAPLLSLRPLQDLCVLYAEDGPDNQRLIRFLLERAGAHVHVVGNGAQAVEAALAASRAHTPFDLILMDMQMPEMDGYTAASQLRAQQYPGIIIALTAHAMTGERDKCLRAGCNEYLTKPVDKNALYTLCASMAKAA
jgi:signal transduction histidine kinase/ActR/RegA family two-component response regulator